LAIEIPPTHHATIDSRSGLATKRDIEVGCPGAPIDSDYRGEFTILLRNFGRRSFKVEKFMKIAQLIVQPRILVKWVESTELSKTERGDKGHGSTGLY
jgi:dUTP pyrophosphatase